MKAQEYLDKNYPKKERSQIIELYIAEKNLTDSLDLSDFVNLEVLDCYGNELTSLKADKCAKLQSLYCYNNELTSLKTDNCLKLKNLSCYNNNFPKQNLSMFSHLVNLEYLDIENSEEYEDQDIYNRFTGSLEPLKDLTKLIELIINNTDIDSGLEYLSDSVETFSCYANPRKDAKCKNLQEQIAPYNNNIQTLRLFQKNQQIQSLQEQLNKKETETQRLEEQLQEKSNELEKKQQELAYYSEKIEKLAEKDEILGELQKEVKDVLNNLQEKEKLLEEKDINQEKLQKEIDKLKTNLVEKEQEINKLQAEKNMLIQRIILHKKLTEQVEAKKLELKKLKSNYMKNRVIKKADIEEKLETFLKAQGEIIRLNRLNISTDFATEQKTKARDFLQKQSGFDKLRTLEENQQKLTELEIQLEDLEKLEKEFENKFNQEKKSETSFPTKNDDSREKKNKEKEFGLNLGATVFGHGGNIGFTYKSRTSPQPVIETSEPQLSSQPTTAQPIQIIVNTSNSGN